MEKITSEQFNPKIPKENKPTITAVDSATISYNDTSSRVSWGVGPYFAHRLFNPDMPLSMETGIEVEAGYRIATGFNISGAVRKSILTNLTDNKQRSNSPLPRVHSDWPLYDKEGQSGHIHSLKFSYLKI